MRDAEDEIEQLRRRVRALVAAGSLSKAANELLSAGLCPPTNDVQAKLEALHPQASLPPPVPVLDSPEIDTQEVVRALKSFPVSSAPGPSGLRAEHLKECLQCSSGLQERLLEALSPFVETCLKGEFPSRLAHLLLGARLLPFRKASDLDGVRPIAVGEVLRRLAAKVLLTKVTPSARQLLPPLRVA